MPAHVRLVALCMLALFSAGCGSSSSNSTVNLRIVQASPDAPPSKILIDGTSVASNAVYGNNAGYQSVKVGSQGSINPGIGALRAAGSRPGLRVEERLNAPTLMATQSAAWLPVPCQCGV